MPDADDSDDAVVVDDADDADETDDADDAYDTDNADDADDADDAYDAQDMPYAICHILGISFGFPQTVIDYIKKNVTSSHVVNLSLILLGSTSWVSALRVEWLNDGPI